MAIPTAIAGRAGAVVINGTPVTTVALIKSWTATITLGLYDQTALGDVWTSNVAGFRKMAGKISGSWDVASDPGQTTLHNAILNAVTVGLNLWANSSTPEGYELTAYLSDFTATTPVDNLVTFEASFENQGQIFFT